MRKKRTTKNCCGFTHLPRENSGSSQFVQSKINGDRQIILQKFVDTLRLTYSSRLKFQAQLHLKNKIKGTDRPFGGGVESILIRSLLVNWRLGYFYYPILKGLIHKINKKPLDAKSLWLVKATLCWFLYSVRSLYAITPIPYNECTQLVQKIFWFNWMKVTLRSRQTAYIHSTELVWPRTFIVRSWCDRVHS